MGQKLQVTVDYKDNDGMFEIMWRLDDSYKGENVNTWSNGQMLIEPKMDEFRVYIIIDVFKLKLKPFKIEIKFF